MNQSQVSNLLRKQRGAALIILAIIMILTVLIVIIGNSSRNVSKLRHEANISKRLNAAKTVILDIALTNNLLPGLLIYPDRGAGDLDFNGRGDCVNAGLPINPLLLIGRLPYIDQESAGAGCMNVPPAGSTIGMDLGQILRDPTDPLFVSTPNADPQPLHYAVSQNLVQYKNSTDINTINSSVLNLTTNWLTVYDENGATLNNRVVLIIFYPGSPLPGQNQSLAALPNTNQFLDQMNVPGHGLISNAQTNPATYGQFVQAQKSTTFNDKLVYVTLSEYTEVMRDIERRMMAELATQLLADFGTGPYPANAAALISTPPPTPLLAGTKTYNGYDNKIGRASCRERV